MFVVGRRHPYSSFADVQHRLDRLVGDPPDAAWFEAWPRSLAGVQWEVVGSKRN